MESPGWLKCSEIGVGLIRLTLMTLLDVYALENFLTMTGSRQLTLLTTLPNVKGRGLHLVEEKWLLTHLLTLFSKILCFRNQPASATIFRNQSGELLNNYKSV